jgi:hypothetical protein
VNDDEILSAHKAAIELLRRQIAIYHVVGERSAALDLLNGYLIELKKMPLSKVSSLLRRRNYSSKNDKSDVQINMLPAIEQLSLEDVARFVSKDGLSRKVLEDVAIRYFHVPKGSMRSFRNIEALKKKLATLIENERARLTIGNIAHKTRT